jgi:hypothetical protein
MEMRECFLSPVQRGMIPLEAMGMLIEQRSPGIYYVTGNLLFPVQLVVGNQLSPKQHSSLRILSKHAKEEDVAAFLNNTRRFNEPGDKNNTDAVLQVSIAANPILYRVIRRDDQAMCEALRELMKDDIAQGRAEGRAEGAKELLFSLVKDGLISIKEAAARLNLTESAFIEQMNASQQ